MAVFSHTTFGSSAKAVCLFYDLIDIMYLHLWFVLFFFLLLFFLNSILSLEETKLRWSLGEQSWSNN